MVLAVVLRLLEQDVDAGFDEEAGRIPHSGLQANRANRDLCQLVLVEDQFGREEVWVALLQNQLDQAAETGKNDATFLCQAGADFQPPLAHCRHVTGALVDGEANSTPVVNDASIP